MSLDIREILRAVESGHRSLTLATVVETFGSCYRKTGARMLIGDGRRLAGSISDGRLERDVTKQLARSAQEGPKVLTFDTNRDEDEEELRLGGSGTVLVLVQNISVDSQQVRTLRAVDRRRGHAAIITILASHNDSVAIGTDFVCDGEDYGTLPAWAKACTAAIDTAWSLKTHQYQRIEHAHGSYQVLVEYVPPPRHLLIAGNGYDVGPVVRCAKTNGWTVTLAAGDATDDTGTPDARIDATEAALRDWCAGHPDSATVVMNHNWALDRMCLQTLLTQPEPAFIGILGPRSRTDALLHAIRDTTELSADSLARIHSPVGIPVGGEGAQAIALSIVAELEYVFSQREHPVASKA